MKLFGKITFYACHGALGNCFTAMFWGAKGLGLDFLFVLGLIILGSKDSSNSFHM